MANEKDILYTRTCSLCRNKLKLLDRHYLHMLSDGTLCQMCHMTILQLLSERHCWISEEEYMKVMQKKYNFREHHSMPLEKAQDLFALRDRVCNRFLETVDLNEGNVFVAKKLFAMPKSPPYFHTQSHETEKESCITGIPSKRYDTKRRPRTDQCCRYHP